MADHDVIIVGAGLAGLSCALHLGERSVPALVLEASDGVGGRVRTDQVEGFLLDRGFQVLLEAYPECKRLLDYEALDLKPFYPGARIWTGEGFTLFSDPYRRPQDALATLASPVGTFSDKLKVTRLKKETSSGEAASLLSGPDRTAMEDLEAMGFTSGMIRGFFRPFFGGVLLDRHLTDSSRIFRYIFRMFSNGDISVPARGMGEIPRQLAGRLDPGAIRLNARVEAVGVGQVRLESGEVLTARDVVVATEGPEASRLLPAVEAPDSKGTRCLYFEAPEPPLDEPILALDGTGAGPVNNLAVMSSVSPGYAPPGEAPGGRLLYRSLRGGPGRAGGGGPGPDEGVVRRRSRGLAAPEDVPDSPRPTGPAPRGPGTPPASGGGGGRPLCLRGSPGDRISPGCPLLGTAGGGSPAGPPLLGRELIPSLPRPYLVFRREPKRVDRAVGLPPPSSQPVSRTR